RSRTLRRGIRAPDSSRSRRRAGRRGSPSHRGGVGRRVSICRRRRIRQWRSATESSSSCPTSASPRWRLFRWWLSSSSEVPVLLAVFHRRGRDPVVGASGSALGHSGGGHLGEDRLEVIGARFDGSGAAHVSDGAVADLLGRDGLAVAWGGEFAGGPPHAVALEDFAFV